jgi:hypothetical protein
VPGSPSDPGLISLVTSKEGRLAVYNFDCLKIKITKKVCLPWQSASALPPSAALTASQRRFLVSAALILISLTL